MKMPASGGDPVSSNLRIAFSSGSKSDLDCGVEASAKRVLLTRIEYEPATNYQSSVLNSLKSKYIVINTKAHLDNSKAVNGSSANSNKKSNNNVTLPIPKLTLFPPERVQLGYRGNVSVGSGMSNMGNTCYLNSTLQALFHVPALVNWLVSETAHQKCEQNSDYQMHPDDITCSVIKTFKCSQQKTGTCMKPFSVYQKLKAICKHLSHGSQEDAHEFMRYLLESLEKNYLTRFQGHKLDSASKETTPINQIFGGYIRTEVTCLSCTAVSTTFQHFQDLPLDIRKASTLNDALAGYFERERLPDGEDAYKCEKCNRKVPATKKFTIEKPPNVLCVQLKRFSMTNGKITKQVQLPECLDVTRFISPSVQPRHPVTYRLVSMVTHMGQSANCGHYTAIALAANNRYYQFDDSSVRQIPTSTVLSMGAYLVLYEIDKPFTPANNPKPHSAPATISRKESSINGEQEDSWIHSESTGSGSSQNNGRTDREIKREGNESRSRMGYQPKHGKAYAPPTPHNTAMKSSSKIRSLVPYESDVSTDSDVENKDRSELERLLLTESSSSTKGWKVTRQDDPLTSGKKSFTTTWDVTDVNVPKLARNLSDTELASRKKKKHKTSGSDSEIDKKIDDKKKRTSILERYKNNFGKCLDKDKSTEEKEEAKKTSWSSLHHVEQKPKPIQFERSIAVNGHESNGNVNGSISNTTSNNGGNDKSQMRRNGFDGNENGTEGEDKVLADKIESETEKNKKKILDDLLTSSSWQRGYGTPVKKWNGHRSSMERETEEERRETSKRTYDDFYNDEFDKGKAKKVKMNDYNSDKDRERVHYNLFQERANQQQQQQQHWRSNNNNLMNSNRYNDYRNSYKARHNFHNRFNGNNNWNHRRRNNKYNHGHKYYNSYRY